jgi:hypothetical protein
MTRNDLEEVFEVFGIGATGFGRAFVSEEFFKNVALDAMIDDKSSCFVDRISNLAVAFFGDAS